MAVGAISRLKAIEPLLRYATSVKTYSSSAHVSAFEVTLNEGKFFLVLSPNAARGFSGEGQALSDLADRVADVTVAKVRANLAWQNNLDPDKLALELDAKADDITNALKILGTRGLVGYDLSNSSYFHRELPFDLSLVEDLSPRVNKARRLVQDEAVRITETFAQGSKVFATVSGDRTDHLVEIQEESFRCTCDWYAKYEGNRGPCSHVLAVEIKIQEAEQ